MAEWVDVHQKNPAKKAQDLAMLREVHNAGAVIPRRIGTGKLRAALRRYDRDHRGDAGVRSTFNFLRVEAVLS
jgi:hypothetical protein